MSEGRRACNNDAGILQSIWLPEMRGKTGAVGNGIILKKMRSDGGDGRCNALVNSALENAEREKRVWHSETAIAIVEFRVPF